MGNSVSGAYSGIRSMKSVEELCQYYMSFIRAIGILHQNGHWTTRGENFYGNHLMLERVYKSILDDMDLMAEKFIGLFGKDCLDLHAQSQIIPKLLDKYVGMNDPLEASLAGEKDFIEFSEHFYETLKAEDKMSLGLDDAIMAVASKREEAVYLLSGAAGERAVSAGSVVARSQIFKRILHAV
jgi:DNA-binding ferritin-like protein